MISKKRILILAAGMAFVLCSATHGRTDIGTKKGPDTIAHDTDQAFQEMGIVKIPRTASPTGTGLLDLMGKKVSLSKFKGNIVFVNFWTTWCGGCREEMPSMENLHNRLKDKNFVMVAIDVKQPASWVTTFFEKHKLSFTALLDSTGKTSDKFGVRALPTTFILDRDGSIIGKAFGPRSWDSKASIALFEELMRKKTDDQPPESKSF